jgi:predicted metal-dependent phosphoesterase TrpH
MTPEETAEAAVRAGLDGLCVTEHNKLWSRDEAADLAKRFGLLVLRGVEVTTTGGDILAFGLEQAPESLISPAELKKLVDASHGLAIAAHPFRGFLLFGFSAMSTDLKEASDNLTFQSVHGLEVCNSMVTDAENALAGDVADALGLLKVGGSDAHSPAAVGKCVMNFHESLRDEYGLIELIRARAYTLERAD